MVKTENTLTNSCWLQNGRYGKAVIKAVIYDVNSSDARKANEFFSDLFEIVSQNLKKTGQFFQVPIHCILAIPNNRQQKISSVDEITPSFPLTKPDRYFQLVVFTSKNRFSYLT